MHDAPRKLRVELSDPSISPSAREVWRDGVDLKVLRAKLRDRRMMIARMAASGALLFGIVALTFAHLHNSPYSASAELLISNTTLQVSGQDAAVTQVMVDNSLIESEIELLKSGVVLGRVVDTVGLDAVGSALPPPSIAPPFRLGSLFHSNTPLEDGDVDAQAARRRTVIAALSASIVIKRLGASQIISVRAKSGNANGATMLANEVAHAFVDEEEISNHLVTTSAAFRERIKMLGAGARIVSPATPPIAKDGPGPLTILAFAVLAGGLGGFVLAFAFVLCDQRVTAREQLGLLAPAEFLGYVPRLEAPTLCARRWPLPDLLNLPHSLWTNRGHSPARWAYESFDPVLRRARLVAQERFARSPRVIAVTSCSAGEGVTTMASSLARLLASQGRRAILIDANEQKPDLSRSFALDAAVGVKQVLDGRVSYDDAVLTDIGDNLEFLPLGESDGSPEMYWPEIFRLVGERVDLDTWIILDMPPIEEGVAVRSAADIVDGLLLVVAKGRTTLASLEDCQRLLGPAGHKLFGVVINDAPKFRGQEADLQDHVGADARRGGPAPDAVSTDEEIDLAPSANETGPEFDDMTPAWEER
jgi:Mrp family chromosome partitioning ATPase/capsular polysaccharide biosynthesis protein